MHPSRGFGGKSRVGHLVWSRFGNVPNYVEPFAGSLAVLLARPSPPKVETVNDRDCYLSNFWRAIQLDPEAVARAADWPVNEADLHARHRWLVEQAEFRERMMTDPDHYDAKIAGWWVWGISQWIGGGWCSNPEWTGRVSHGAPRGIHGENIRQRPDLSSAGRGSHCPRERADGTARRGRPALRGMGVHIKNPLRLDGTPPEKRPRLGKGGTGVHNTVPQKLPLIGGTRGTGVHARQIPDLSGDSGAAGRGVHASGLHRKAPKADRGTASRLQGDSAALLAWFGALADRLRYVRVCCGDWRRTLGPSPTVHIGTTAVFLDPPYSAAAGRDTSLYGTDDLEVSHAVREWALLNGDNPKLRIALCGYEGEHDMPPTWAVTAWTSQGGYGSQARARGRENRSRERIWFSPHCHTPADSGPLFRDRTEEETA